MLYAVINIFLLIIVLYILIKLFLENDDVKKRNESDDWSLNGLYM